MKRLALAVAAAWLVTGCATAQVAVPNTDVADLERTLRGDARFLRVSMHVTPFYGDQTRKLLTPVAPELVRFLDDASGKPMNPGPIEATFGAGTPVRIMKVEFPSGWAMAERVLYTPRTLVWVYVDVAGRSGNAAPTVLVLRPGISTKDEFNTELERLLSRQDPAQRLEGFSDAVRAAIKTKRAVKDMPADALEMAWGYPESKRVELIDSQRRETWYWGDKAREATLVDGRLTGFTEASGASSSSSP